MSDLLTAASGYLSSRDDELATWFGNRVAARVGDPVVTAPVPPAAEGGLARFAPVDPMAAEVCNRIDAAVDQLTWFQSSEARVPPGWVHRAAACNIVGPDGMIDHPEYLFGVFYIGPNTHYPSHWHQAEELYVVVGGEAEFEIGGTTTTRRVGDVSVTPTMAPHAITTGDEAVMLLFGWRGEISFDSYAY